MALGIIVFFLLAMYHYIFESAIAPSVRLNLRYRLFKIRDELRRQKFIQSQRLDSEIFCDLQGAINNLLRFQARIDFRFLTVTQRIIESDAELSRILKDRKAQLENCPVAEVQKIRKELLKISMYVLMVNTGGWVIYFVPIALAMMGFDGIKAMVKTFVYFPEENMGKISTTTKFKENSPDLSYA